MNYQKKKIAPNSRNQVYFKKRGLQLYSEGGPPKQDLKSKPITDLLG